MCAAYTMCYSQSRKCLSCHAVNACLQPGLANLLEPFVVVGAAAHSVKILRNKRMVVVRQCKPIHARSPLLQESVPNARPTRPLTHHFRIAPSRSARRR